MSTDQSSGIIQAWQILQVTYSNRFQGGTGSILVFGDEHQILLIKFTSSGAVGCLEKIHIVASKTGTPKSSTNFLGKCGSRNQPDPASFPNAKYFSNQDTTTAGTVPVTAGPSELWMSRDICRVLGGRVFCRASRKKHPSYVWHSLVHDYADYLLSQATKLWLKGDIYFWSW